MRKIWLILLLFLQATLIAYGVDVSKAVGSIPVWRLTAENNLGSITHLVSPAGTKVAETAYDAWGRTRSTTNWSLYEYTNPQTLLYRGYAGYPALQTLGLYHASARIYDPLTGRFLGYDPVVQDPNNSQNWNSYAYCLNNPFRYTDPDGKFIISGTLAVTLTIVGVAAGAGLGVWEGSKITEINGWTGSKRTWSMIGGGLIGGVAGFAGSLVGAEVAAVTTVGGFIGGATVGGAAGAASGAVNGFGMTLLAGGSVGEAFKQMAYQSAIGGLSGAIMGGIIQGSISAYKGNNFWDGSPFSTSSSQSSTMTQRERLKANQETHKKSVNKAIDLIKGMGGREHYQRSNSICRWDTCKS